MLNQLSGEFATKQDELDQIICVTNQLESTDCHSATLLTEVTEKPPSIVVRLLRAFSHSNNLELSTENLKSFVNWDDHRVRFYLADVLGQIASPTAVELLRTLLNDSNANVVLNTIEVLFECNTNSAIESLVEGLSQENRPKIQKGYLNHTLSNPDPRFESVIIEILRNKQDRQLKFFCVCFLKIISSSTLSDFAKNDAYIEKIRKKQPVNSFVGGI